MNTVEQPHYFHITFTSDIPLSLSLFFSTQFVYRCQSLAKTEGSLFMRHTASLSLSYFFVTFTFFLNIIFQKTGEFGENRGCAVYESHYTNEAPTKERQLNGK